MAKISQKAVDETITTSGYTVTRTAATVHITDRDGATIGEGTHTSTGRLRIFITPLKTYATTVAELGRALDNVSEARR